jgi:type VI secretion system protein ImpF
MVKRIVATLLDRLLNDGPTTSRDVREGLRRDLENVLNNSICVIGWGNDKSSLDSSILNYGVIDITTLNVSTPDQKNNVAKELQRQIALLDPRFDEIQITVQPNRSEAEQALRLRLELSVEIDNVLESILMESLLDPLALRVSVKAVSA